MDSSLPAMLMASSSVLVDATFRREQYRDRIWTQLLLWLAVSLQNQHSPLIHCVFGSSILSCTFMAAMLQWSFSWWRGPDYSRLMAPSMLLALLYESFQSWMGFSTSPWLVVVAIFIGLCAWRWYSHQRYERRQSLVGMPVVSSTVNLHDMALDESQWSCWTRSEFLQWISSLDPEWRHSVCGILAPEAITGSVMTQITADDLRSMAVSYGDSHRIVQHIQLLTSKYPNRNESDFCNSHQHQREDTLPEWYGGESQPFNFEQAMAPRQPKTFINENDELSEEVVHKAKALMKERFGFELPDFKLVNEEESPCNAAMIKSSASSEQGRNSNESSAVVREKSSSVEDDEVLQIEGLPLEMVAAMPDHIRDVAMRRPELVRELWTAQRLEEKQDPVDPERIRQLIHNARPYRPQETAIPNGASDDDKETTSLLRKRAPNQKYASIG